MEIISKGFRIGLRTLGPDDADDLAKNASDYEVAYSVARTGEFPFPYTKEYALYFIASALEKQHKGNEFHFGIRLDSMTIGACALMNVNSPEAGQCEAGYWIGRKYWGSGYASEALKLLLGFGFASLGMSKICARTFRSNERSVNLLHSLGFSDDGAASSSDEITLSIARNRYDAIALEITGDEAP
jgi:RimJ/RimL family protein N-acetyltransferase